MSLNGPTEVQVCASSAVWNDVLSAVAKFARNALPTLDSADVGFDPAGESVMSCSRGSRESESCAPASRGLSIHLAQARKSRLADSSTRNTARTG
jgi:hypothetical protein